MNSRVAIVTGAAGAIGGGIVAKLVEDGRRVVMVGTDETRLRKAAARFDPATVFAVVIPDICAADAPHMIDDAVRAVWEPASILVNNAGISPFASVSTVTSEEWARVHEVNLSAPMRLVAHFLPFMKQQRWGRIINISSRAGRSNPNTAGVAYATSKAGMLGLTRSIATTAGPFGITCNTVAPGFVESDLSLSLTPEAIKILIERTPVGRAGTPREVGAAVAFLASEDSGFVTGTCVDVNGGQSML